MEFIDFLGEMLGITKDFTVTKFEKSEFVKTINIHPNNRNRKTKTSAIPLK